MDFNKAFEALNSGKKIRRTGMRADAYLYRFNNVIFMGFFEKGSQSYGVQCDDLISKDWEIVEVIPEVKLRVKELFTCPKCGHVNMDFQTDDTYSTCKECMTKVKMLHVCNEKKIDYSNVFSIYREWLEDTISDLNHRIWNAEYTKVDYMCYSRDLVQTCLDNFKKLESEVLNQQRQDTN